VGAESITRAKSSERARFAANYDTSKVVFWQNKVMVSKEWIISEKNSKFVIFSPLLLDDFKFTVFCTHNDGGGEVFSEIKTAVPYIFYKVSCNFNLFMGSYKGLNFKL
jgi:hypothetical protein